MKLRLLACCVLFCSNNIVVLGMHNKEQMANLSNIKNPISVVSEVSEPVSEKCSTICGNINSDSSSLSVKEPNVSAGLNVLASVATQIRNESQSSTDSKVSMINTGRHSDQSIVLYAKRYVWRKVKRNRNSSSPNVRGNINSDNSSLSVNEQNISDGLNVLASVATQIQKESQSQTVSKVSMINIERNGGSSIVPYAEQDVQQTAELNRNGCFSIFNPYYPQRLMTDLLYHQFNMRYPNPYIVQNIQSRNGFPVFNHYYPQRSMPDLFYHQFNARYSNPWVVQNIQNRNVFFPRINPYYQQRTHAYLFAQQVNNRYFMMRMNQDRLGYIQRYYQQRRAVLFYTRLACKN